MSDHAIYFMQPITQATLGGLQNVLLNALQQNASKLTIYISTEGGGNDQAFAAYNFIRSLPAPVTMHCIGNVESMGIIMFMAADTRLITPYGKVKAHPMHWGFPGGPVDHDRLAEFVDSMDFDAERYAKIFDERTAAAETKLNIRDKLAGRAEILDAERAVSTGIATAIAEAKLSRDAVRWWV